MTLIKQTARVKKPLEHPECFDTNTKAGVRRAQYETALIKLSVLFKERLSGVDNED